MEGAYYNTKESVNEYIRLAKGVDGRQLIEQLAEILPSNSTVLEIGSGPGSDWNMLNQRFQVIGSDNSMEFVRHLKTENPKGEFIALDAVSLKTDQQFDGIYSNKVMHHLPDDDLKESIQRQSDILHPKGIICHSFWRGEDSEIFKGLFVNYHEIADIKVFFEPLFEIISIAYYREFEDDDSIFLIARKK